MKNTNETDKKKITIMGWENLAKKGITFRDLGRAWAYALCLALPRFGQLRASPEDLSLCAERMSAISLIPLRNMGIAEEGRSQMRFLSMKLSGWCGQVA